MEIKLNLSHEEHKQLVAYCNLNDKLISSVVKDSFTTGFNIERYGLLNSGVSQEKEVVKEVIVEKRVEIPVEVVKEVVKIEYVEVEKPVEKIVYATNHQEIQEIEKNFQNEKNELLLKIQQLESKEPEVREIVREFPVEVIKETAGVDKSKFDALQQTVLKLRSELLEKDKRLREYESTIQEIQNFQQKQGMYLKGSNLDDKLYK